MMAERNPYQELLDQYPEGSEDPKIAAKLREAREKAGVAKQGKGHVVGFDGRVYSEDEFNAMSPAKKRGICVGSTCIHYESDVPGMSDTDTEKD